VIIPRKVAYARQEQVLLFVDIIWKLIACHFITQEVPPSEADSTPEEKKKRRISDAKKKVGRLLHSNPRVLFA
jgi:hypothetical protein